MIDSRSEWSQLERRLLLLLVLVFCVHIRSVYFGAFADDDVYLAFANRFLREAPWTELYQLLLRPANPIEFLPIRDFTYWLDFKIYGDEPSGFHVTNLIWYAASGGAVFWLCREAVLFFRPAWQRYANALSTSGVIVFVAHPAHVEAVAWISSRKDLVAATFGLMALAMLMRAFRNGAKLSAVLASAGFAFVACFGKASAITNLLPIAVLLLCANAPNLDLSKARRACYLLLYSCLFALAAYIHFQMGEIGGIRIANAPGTSVMLDRASRILVMLLGILVAPYRLRFYYDVYQLGDWHWLLTILVITLLTASLWMLKTRRALWAFGVVLSLSPLVVYLQLSPYTTWSMASERFVFVSVVGLSLAVIDVLARVGNPKYVLGLTLSLAFVLSVGTWSRLSDWDRGPGFLLEREYEIQPTHHNAMRDHIVFRLLPKADYDQAQVVARMIRRDYASSALLALIDVERTYRELRALGSTTEPTDAARRAFCVASERLRRSVKDGQLRIRDELDVSYNNILRMIEKYLASRYGDSTTVCRQ